MIIFRHFVVVIAILLGCNVCISAALAGSSSFDDVFCLPTNPETGKITVLNGDRNLKVPACYFRFPVRKGDNIEINNLYLLLFYKLENKIEKNRIDRADVQVEENSDRIIRLIGFSDYVNMNEILRRPWSRAQPLPPLNDAVPLKTLLDQPDVTSERGKRHVYYRTEGDDVILIIRCPATGRSHRICNVTFDQSGIRWMAYVARSLLISDLPEIEQWLRRIIDGFEH